MTHPDKQSVDTCSHVYTGVANTVVWCVYCGHTVRARHGKRCTRCDLVKELDAFNINQAASDGLCYACRDCQRDAYEARRTTR